MIAGDRPAGFYNRDEPEFDRAVAFFDATFALALTLLVTTLDVSDERSNWLDFGALGDAVGSQFIAFVISFAVIAVYWFHNHRLVASLASIDTPLIVTSLALVGTVVLLPFTTEAMGAGEVDDLPLPTVVYSLNIAAASLLTVAVYLVARRRGLLRDLADRPSFAATLAGGLIPAFVFLCSIPVAYLASPEAARWSWLSLLVLTQIPRFLRR